MEANLAKSSELVSGRRAAGPRKRSRALVAGAACLVFMPFAALVAMAGDETGVYEFLNRQNRAARPHQPAPLPAIFAPAQRRTAGLLGFAPFGELPRYGSAPARLVPSQARLRRYTPIRLHDAALAPEKPLRQPGDDHIAARGPAGAGFAYCVRLCDGFYFPINQPGASSETLQASCDALCPTTKTRLYSTAGGSDISTALAHGKPYTALPAAFAYRTRVSNACSCTAQGFGLEPQDARRDGTLRRGDVIALDEGLRVYRGLDPSHIGGRDFVALSGSNLVPPGERRVLSALKVRPNGPTLQPEPVAVAASSSGLKPLRTEGVAVFERLGPPARIIR